MPRLTHSDLRAALRFLSDCDAGGGLHAFALSATAGLPAIIPCDVAVFGLFNPTAQVMTAVENPRLTTQADLDTFVRVSEGLGVPPQDHFARTNDPEARLLSDFLSRRQFHALPLYAEFYRPLRVEFMMGAFINNTPTAFDGVTLSRSRRDFSERDRQVLTVLRPHLVHGYHTAIAVDRLRVDLALALRAVDTAGFGIVLMSESGRIQFLSPGGATLLATYFGARRQVDALPDSLGRWFRAQAEAARDSSRLPALLAPFVVERNRARLVVRVVQVARQSLLLLEEPETRGTWQHLSPLGLSGSEARSLFERLREELTARAVMPTKTESRVDAQPRNKEHSAPATYDLTPHEVRVLGLLVEGHSYKTAAAALGSSVHTIAFHVKHIYGKLRVHSRAEAVAKALRERIVE